MVDRSSSSSLRPKHLRLLVWSSVLLGIGFIAVMVLSLEATFAWAVGAWAGTPGLGLVLAAALMGPTLWLLLARGLRRALDAEWEAVRPSDEQVGSPGS